MPSRVGLPFRPNPSKDDNLSGYNPKNGRPILFQVSAPGTLEPIFPYMLALHTNPSSIEEGMTKTKTVVPTYGGFVEFVWPDELSTISASHSTGAFLTPGAGLTSGSDQENSSGVSSGRRGSMAWERQEDLLDLFHNNGIVLDGDGLPAIRGSVIMIYDRGIFTGHFTNFEVEESDDKPWSFELSWEFRIEKTLYLFTGLNAASVSVSNTEPTGEGV